MVAFGNVWSVKSDVSKIALNICMQTGIIFLKFYSLFFIICIAGGRVRCATTCHENSKWQEQSNILLQTNRDIKLRFLSASRARSIPFSHLKWALLFFRLSVFLTHFHPAADWRDGFAMLRANIKSLSILPRWLPKLKFHLRIPSCRAYALATSAKLS